MKSKSRFFKNSKVEVVCGESLTTLKDAISKLKALGFSKIAFFLDGHYSGTKEISNEKISTFKSDLDAPVFEEIEIIMSNVSNFIIFVDDCRLFCDFGLRAAGYRSVNEIIHLVELNKVEITFAHDMIMLRK